MKKSISLDSRFVDLESNRVLCHLKMPHITEAMNISHATLSSQPNPVLPQKKHDTTNHIREDQ